MQLNCNMNFVEIRSCYEINAAEIQLEVCNEANKMFH